ncbi:MAG TPA: hypothetical protein PKX55_25615, partial [Leptospiraceae bacterium]|nr:hypothetical protein [Leptospiraceae bacterium]
MPYVEIEKNDDHWLIYPTADIRLNVLGNLLTSHIPWSNFLEQLHKKPYEYCDDTYFITIVEDKILIGDGDLGYNILPPHDKFLDLLHQWRLINSRKFKLIKL